MEDYWFGPLTDLRRKFFTLFGEMVICPYFYRDKKQRKKWVTIKVLRQVVVCFNRCKSSNSVKYVLTYYARLSWSRKTGQEN
jgi:hypothetical protein